MQWAHQVVHCTCTPLTTVFLATQNGGVVSRFLSIFSFYVWLHKVSDKVYYWSPNLRSPYYFLGILFKPEKSNFDCFFFFFARTRTQAVFFPLINVDSRKCSHGSALESSLLSLPSLYSPCTYRKHASENQTWSVCWDLIMHQWSFNRYM